MNGRSCKGKALSHAEIGHVSVKSPSEDISFPRAQVLHENLTFILFLASFKAHATSISSPLSFGAVCKRTVKRFLNKRSFKILRKKGGIPEDFQKKVYEAMDLEKSYNLLTFNCLHFALTLLFDGEKFQLTYVFINVQCQ